MCDTRTTGSGSLDGLLETLNLMAATSDNDEMIAKIIRFADMVNNMKGFSADGIGGSSVGAHIEEVSDEIVTPPVQETFTLADQAESSSSSFIGGSQPSTSVTPPVEITEIPADTSIEVITSDEEEEKWTPSLGTASEAEADATTSSVDDRMLLASEAAGKANKGAFQATINMPFTFDFAASSHIIAAEDAAAKERLKEQDLRKRWMIIREKDLKSSDLHHRSTQPHDFINDVQYRECMRLQAGENHKLHKSEKFALYDPGYKIVLRVVSAEKDARRSATWIRDAALGVLAHARIPSSGVITLYDFKRRDMDWQLLILTEEAFKAFEGVRAIFDGQSQVLVLVRPWDAPIPRHQTFPCDGIVTLDDDTQEKVAMNANRYKAIANTAYERQGAPISITSIEAKARPGHVYNVYVTLASTVALDPMAVLPNSFEDARGLTRKVTMNWPSRCSYCLSESHEGIEERCLWKRFVFQHPSYGERVADPRSAPRYDPGEGEVNSTTERDPKRKRTEDDQVDVSVITPKKLRTTDGTAPTSFS